MNKDIAEILIDEAEISEICDKIAAEISRD